MHKVLISMRNLIIIGVITVSMGFVLFNVNRITSISFKTEEDRSNYAVVAENFVRKNGYIANKLGKVESLNHVGKGGESGGKSFNVFKVSGEQKRAICNIMVEMDENEEWFVTSADLLVSGKTFRVPVKRSVGDKWKGFKLK